MLHMNGPYLCASCVLLCDMDSQNSYDICILKEKTKHDQHLQTYHNIEAPVKTAHLQGGCILAPTLFKM